MNMMDTSPKYDNISPLIPKIKIGKYSMANHFDFLDDFVEKMKSKILERDGKYGHQPTTEKSVREHLVDEILELYDLKPSDKIYIRRIFNNAAIDKSELIDVANLCWILIYFLENGAPE